MKIETSTKIKGTDFKKARVPEGIYIADLKEVKDISDGTFGQRVAFIYVLNDPKSSGQELAHVCYKSKATVDNKIGRALMAHGEEITDGEVDTDNLKNKKVRVWVEDFESEREIDGKLVKEIASTISKVKPLEEN